MEKVNFIFLHGFLGQPEDWSPLTTKLKNHFPMANYTCLDYFKFPPLSPKNSFSKWVENFFLWLEVEHANEDVILFGYSLGGRLALHAFEQKPERFKRLFLISTNPGIKEHNAFDRIKRLEEDQIWARRFLVDSWSDLLSGWNAQPVFAGGTPDLKRDESQFRRDLLSKALTNWSLGSQKNFEETLVAHQKKITWVVGDFDKKYIQITKDIFKTCPQMNFFICPKSSHRVMQDQPEELANGLLKVLEKVFQNEDID